MFHNIDDWCQCQKTIFSVSLTLLQNKLGCLFPAKPFQAWQGRTETYFTLEKQNNDKDKMFYDIDNWCQYQKTFFSFITDSSSK
jgi:hypothetical protein